MSLGFNDMSRIGRQFRRIAVGSLLIAWLSGCGFHLRGSMSGGAEAKLFYVTGINSKHPFWGDFAQALGTAGGALAPKPQQAGAVIDISLARHERRVLTLSQQGRGNTFDLSFRLIYEIRSPKGEVLVPRQELEVRRDYFNDQSSPLGQFEEEALMRVEMEKEAAQTLLRRVVATVNRISQTPKT